MKGRALMVKRINKDRNSSSFTVSTFLTSLIILFTLFFAPATFAASVDEIENNSLRIGNDVYSLSSSNLTDDKIAQSISTGGNKAFYKFNGKWFDVFAADSDTYWDDPANALSDVEVAAWASELKNWYKGGSEVVEFQRGADGNTPIEPTNVIDVRAIDKATVTVMFGTPLEEASDYTRINFTFDNGLAVHQAQLRPGTNNRLVELTTSAHTPGETYTLSYKGNPTNLSFTALEADSPSSPTGITFDISTGTIDGYNSETMEYRINGEGEWKSTPAPTPHEGDFVEIRFKETATKPAGYPFVFVMPELGVFVQDYNITAEYFFNEPIHTITVEVKSSEVYSIYVEGVRMNYEGSNMFILFTQHLLNEGQAVVQLNSPFGDIIDYLILDVPNH